MKRPHLSTPRANAARRQAQRGIALITSMLILIVVTLVAISMYRSFGVQEKIAGNTLEKQRSLQAAESALRYGEWWIKQGNTGTGVNCTGNALSANDLTQMRICSNGLGTPATLPWAGALDYKPDGMSIDTAGGLNAAGTDINYEKLPSLYISYLGLGPDGKSMLFSVTGAGYGGTSTASASVVQSVYSMSYRVVDLSGP